ncbi:MAG TPA: response regulator [Verrucomicrobiae bacterium]|nr:response regulator [Verrucomicrobiae bacterium]
MSKVLVYVDDSPDDLFLFQSACKLAEVRLDLVMIEGGAEAIRYLDGTDRYADRTQFPEPDIVLLDLKMPGVDGFAVLRHLRSDPARAEWPVGLLTSSDWPGDIEQAWEMGATWYFLKPPDMARLIEFVTVLDECLHDATACLRVETRLSKFSS